MSAGIKERISELLSSTPAGREIVEELEESAATLEERKRCARRIREALEEWRARKPDLDQAAEEARAKVEQARAALREAQHQHAQARGALGRAKHQADREREQCWLYLRRTGHPEIRKVREELADARQKERKDKERIALLKEGIKEVEALYLVPDTDEVEPVLDYWRAVAREKPAGQRSDFPASPAARNGTRPTPP